MNTIGRERRRNDCAGPGSDFGSLGDNLISVAAFCNGFDGGGDLVRKRPRIGHLRDNGGPTKTVALKKGSPAIDKSDDYPRRDQRGRPRDRHADIGAFERGA
jgi:hypothetical protein